MLDIIELMEIGEAILEVIIWLFLLDFEYEHVLQISTEISFFFIGAYFDDYIVSKLILKEEEEI